MLAHAVRSGSAVRNQAGGFRVVADPESVLKRCWTVGRGRAGGRRRQTGMPRPFMVTTATGRLEVDAIVVGRFGIAERSDDDDRIVSRVVTHPPSHRGADRCAGEALAFPERSAAPSDKVRKTMSWAHGDFILAMRRVWRGFHWSPGTALPYTSGPAATPIPDRLVRGV